MLRLIIISWLVVSTVAQKGNTELDKAFNRPENATIANLQCENIEGNLKGCYECYSCHEDKIQEKRSQGKQISSLVLIDGDCKSTRICCVAQKDLSFRDSASTTCGASNPNGSPYSERPHLRTVLQGEYPWRAWVYSKTDHSRPLCAATYIDETARALLVPGNCVRGMRPDSIFVRFSKQTQANADVKRIAVHKYFNSDTHNNDIALLSFESFKNIPSWVKPACLPEIALPYGSTCVGVSDNDKSISFGIPEQSQCNETNTKLAASLMCAVGPPRDYQHEYGGGLFCLTNNVRRPTYLVHGIALQRTDNDAVTLYTNIFKYTNWIRENIFYILSNS